MQQRFDLAADRLPQHRRHAGRADADHHRRAVDDGAEGERGDVGRIDDIDGHAVLARRRRERLAQPRPPSAPTARDAPRRSSPRHSRSMIRMLPAGGAAHKASRSAERCHREHIDVRAGGRHQLHLPHQGIACAGDNHAAALEIEEHRQHGQGAHRAGRVSIWRDLSHRVYSAAAGSGRRVDAEQRLDLGQAGAAIGAGARGAARPRRPSRRRRRSPPRRACARPGSRRTRPAPRPRRRPDDPPAASGADPPSTTGRSKQRLQPLDRRQRGHGAPRTARPPAGHRAARPCGTAASAHPRRSGARRAAAAPRPHALQLSGAAASAKNVA